MASIRFTMRLWRLAHQWPAKDQACWLAGTAAPHALDIPTYGQGLMPKSLATIERAYGRYLSWLDAEEGLDPNAAPAARVAPSRVSAYLEHLKAEGYSGQTRLLLLSGLRCAMRILEPEQDWKWVTRPGGNSVLAGLREARKPVTVLYTADLYKWGLTLIQRSESMGGGRNAASTYRDGVLIALLAARPIRLRTLHGLELERHLIHTPTGWSLVLEPGDMKNRRAVEVPVPRTLHPFLEHYLTVVRPALLTDPSSKAVWIASHGRPMAYQAISLMTRRRSLEDFGFEFGPHRFRHALATSATTEDPETPGLAPQILAIGASMVRKHYDRSEEVIAAARFHDALAAEREALLPLARQMLRGRRPPNDDSPNDVEGRSTRE